MPSLFALIPLSALIGFYPVIPFCLCFLLMLSLVWHCGYPGGVLGGFFLNCNYNVFCIIRLLLAIMSGWTLTKAGEKRIDAGEV